MYQESKVFMYFNLLIQIFKTLNQKAFRNGKVGKDLVTDIYIFIPAKIFYFQLFIQGNIV